MRDPYYAQTPSTILASAVIDMVSDYSLLAMEKAEGAAFSAGPFPALVLGTAVSVGIAARALSDSSIRKSTLEQIDNVSSENVTIVVTIWDTGEVFMSAKEWR